MPLTVSATGTRLERDGAFVPLVIDTIWAAFCDVSEEDWRVYLRVRRRQGFTAVVVTALPIVHDRTEGRASRYPYARNVDGTFDYTRVDDEYFGTARRYVEIARSEYGLEVIVAATWVNYLPGTWAKRLPPHVVMPPEVLRDHVARVADLFGPLGAIFSISGDDGFDSPEANALYHDVIDVLRERAPGSLVTAHSAPNAKVPDDVLDRLDFLVYQSGHDVENQALVWEQAITYAGRTPRKPIIDIEPPYEWHGMVNASGRWSQADVRRAAWASVMSGAGAGIGYAAHGVWMWATTGGTFTFAHMSMEPATWVDAIALPGARDMAFLGHLLKARGLDRLDAAQHLLPNVPDPRFRAGASGDGDLIAVYFPYDRPLLVTDDVDARSIEAWDLGARAPLVPELTPVEGGTLVRPTGVLEDALVIAERRR